MVQYLNVRVVKESLEPSVRKRQRIEKTIIRALLIAGIGSGYTISVNNGEEIVLKESTDRLAIMRELMSVDEETLIFHKDGKRAGVFLTYGNDGYDVICDYNTSLEPLMAVPDKLSDAYQEKIWG